MLRAKGNKEFTRIHEKLVMISYYLASIPPVILNTQVQPEDLNHFGPTLPWGNQVNLTLF